MTECEQWSSWEGGPHILIPELVLPAWEGCNPPSGGRVVHAKHLYGGNGIATDYDRVCEVDELIGEISIGVFSGLVLGDEVPMSTLAHHPDGSLVIFVPMTWSREDAFAPGDLPAIAQNTTDRFVDSGIRFLHPGGRVALQPAVFAGADTTPKCKRVFRSLSAGQFAVWTADTQTDDGEFRAHWLRALP